MALIDCASWKPNSNEFVFAYRYPETNLSTHTQLIVYESQEAFLFSKGQLMGKFGPEEEPCLKLLKGMGQCPPEDCGGVYGYGELLELLAKKRKTADDKERLQWYKIEKGYDPNEFDFDLVDDMLYCLWADALR